MPRIINLSTLPTFTAVNVTSDPGAIPGKIQIPSAAQITLYWTLGDGKIGHNVLYGRYPSSFGGTVAQANGILAGLNSGALWTALAAFLATTASLAFVSIRDVNTVDQPIISSNGPAAAGTSASAEMPNEVAAVITLRTALVGPGNRGRIFIPGWATNALGAGNVIAAGAVTALNNWAANIDDVFVANGYTLVLGLRHRAEYTSPLTGTHFDERLARTQQVTSQTVRDNHWDTIRRRGLK